MRTFEITIIALFAVVIFLLLTIVIQFGVFLQRGGAISILARMASINSKLQSLVDISNQMQNAWACDITSIIKLLKELVDIENKSDERNDNMFPFMQEIMSNYNPPCYAPDGICTNPQMDCINCPKRGTGGTWSTSTNIIKND